MRATEGDSPRRAVGRRESLRAERVSIGRVAVVHRRSAGAPLFAAHPDQHDERLAAEAGLAVRRRATERGRGFNGERGWPEPGRPDPRARRALHLHHAADDRRARSGDREGDLEARAREGRRAEPRRVVLARRRPAAAANPGGHNRRTPARARRRDGKAGRHLRRSRRDRPARRRRRQVPDGCRT